MIKERIYSICGVSWFLMDICWFYNKYPLTIFFGIVTLISSSMGLVIYSILTKYKDKTLNHNLAFATFSWIMLNICSLAKEMYQYPIFNHIALIFIILGSLSIIDMMFIDRNFLDKFKRL